MRFCSNQGVTAAFTPNATSSCRASSLRSKSMDRRELTLHRASSVSVTAGRATISPASCAKKTLNIVARQVSTQDARVRSIEPFTRHRVLSRRGSQSAWRRRASAGTSGVCPVKNSSCCSKQNVTVKKNII